MLRATVRGQRWDVVGSALLALGHQLSEAAAPVVVGVVLDRAVGTGDGSVLPLWLAVVAGVFVVLASCGAIGYWSGLPVFGNPANKNRTVSLTAKQLRYSFGNT